LNLRLRIVGRMRVLAVVIGLGFVVVGLIGLRAYLPFPGRRDRSNWPEVEGRILGVSELPDPDLHVLHRPRVAFRTLEGRDVDAWSRNTTYDISRRIGGPISVHYNPATPEDFWVDAGPDAMRPVGWIGLPVCLLFVAVGAGLLVANLR
jgi:hypothetical protein